MSRHLVLIRSVCAICSSVLRFSLRQNKFLTQDWLANLPHHFMYSDTAYLPELTTTSFVSSGEKNYSSLSAWSSKRSDAR